MTTNSDDGLLELADVLARLGREMKRAAEVEDPTIAWQTAEIELESVIERSADGTIRFLVAGGGGRVGDRKTVKVKVFVYPYNEEPMAAACRSSYGPWSNSRSSAAQPEPG